MRGLSLGPTAASVWSVRLVVGPSAERDGVAATVFGTLVAQSAT